MKPLAQAIRTRAAIAGISLNEVERRAGWSPGTLYRVLKTAMSINSLEKIAKAIGCPAWMLIRDAETNEAVNAATSEDVAAITVEAEPSDAQILAVMAKWARSSSDDGIADMRALFAAHPKPAAQSEGERVKCPACDGSGVDGDVNDYGETIDIPCGECDGAGKISDEELGRIAYKGFDSYWTEDCAGKDSEAWTASAKAVIAATKPAPAAPAFQQALDIRIAQGWQLGGNACPVLYTDEINGQQVCRDDLWIATTAGLKGTPDANTQAPAAPPATQVGSEPVCRDCDGTGIDGDCGDDGRTVDVKCGACGGTGKTDLLLKLLSIIDAYAPEHLHTAKRTHLAVAVNRALATTQATPVGVSDEATAIIRELMSWYNIHGDLHNLPLKDRAMAFLALRGSEGGAS